MSDLNFDWKRRGDAKAEPLLSVVDLVVRVGVRRVLDSVSFSIQPGDHVLVTGPNGSGKSTLLNAIAGVEPARIESGRISFSGEDITCMPSHERAMLGIGYMRQTDNVFAGLGVGENLELALGTGGYRLFADAFPDWTGTLPENKRAGQLSGGEKKKLAWAMCTLAKSRIVLADEPDAGVAQRFELPASVGTYMLIAHD